MIKLCQGLAMLGGQDDLIAIIHQHLSALYELRVEEQFS